MMKRPRQAAAIAAPRKSKACFARGIAGSVLMPIASAIRPKGRLTANSHGHEPMARMPEAMVGPKLKAVATTIAL
jgi:hypothetical protein